MKFGKHAKLSDRFYRTLQIEKYLTAATLPPAPQATANLARVYQGTGISDPTKLFPVDGNDTIGNCTIAALAHLITIIYGFLGKTVIPSQSDVEALYYRLTGGPDTGLAMLTVMNWIRKNGWLGDKPVLAFAEVNMFNRPLVEQVISLFGFTYTGFIVPSNCIPEFDAGGPWTKGPLTSDGHCVPLVDYTANGLLVPITWGNVTTATWPWDKECVDESYVIIPAEASTPGYIPGLNTTQLLADLAVVTA